MHFRGTDVRNAKAVLTTVPPESRRLLGLGPGLWPSSVNTAVRGAALAPRLTPERRRFALSPAPPRAGLRPARPHIRSVCLLCFGVGFGGPRSGKGSLTHPHLLRPLPPPPCARLRASPSGSGRGLHSKHQYGCELTPWRAPASRKPILHVPGVCVCVCAPRTGQEPGASAEHGSIVPQTGACCQCGGDCPVSPAYRWLLTTDIFSVLR